MIDLRVTRDGPDGTGAEGLIRPVGGDLEAVTPFARDVELAAGSAAVDRLRQMEELPVGAAVVTPGGELPIPFLIHVVIQSRDEPPSEITVERALRNGLRRAAEWGLSSLALPPLGTGAGGLESERSADVMLETFRSFAGDFPADPEIHVLVSTDYEEDVFRRAVARFAERSGGEAGGSGGAGGSDAAGGAGEPGGGGPGEGGAAGSGEGAGTDPAGGAGTDPSRGAGEPGQGGGSDPASPGA